MSTLILLRHGQSQWNLENKFTGWTDVPLTPSGEQDAASAAKVLGGYKLDLAFTSRLQRARRTLEIMLGALGQNPPTEYDSALNERHYGDLQGLDKAETAAKYGVDQVKLWRRSYTTRPPNGESMEDCARRTLPFFLQYVFPHVIEGKTVIISAHGNSLRPIIKQLRGLSDEQAAALEFEFSTPYVFRFEGEKVIGDEMLEVPGLLVKGGTGAIGAK